MSSQKRRKIPTKKWGWEENFTLFPCLSSTRKVCSRGENGRTTHIYPERRAVKRTALARSFREIELNVAQLQSAQKTPGTIWKSRHGLGKELSSSVFTKVNTQLANSNQIAGKPEREFANETVRLIHQHTHRVRINQCTLLRCDLISTLGECVVTNTPDSNPHSPPKRKTHFNQTRGLRPRVWKKFVKFLGTFSSPLTLLGLRLVRGLELFKKDSERFCGKCENLYKIPTKKWGWERI